MFRFLQFKRDLIKAIHCSDPGLKSKLILHLRNSISQSVKPSLFSLSFIIKMFGSINNSLDIFNIGGSLINAPNLGSADDSIFGNPALYNK